MSEQPKCPECGGGPLWFERDDHARTTGEIIRFDDDDEDPTIDLKDQLSTDYVNYVEQIECRACGAVWPSVDDFATCLFAENHDKECVL